MLCICWILYIWYKHNYIEQQYQLEDIVEGGAANSYIHRDDRKNVDYSPFTTDTGYSHMISNESTMSYAYQNELYAIKVNNRWLFKYGVTGATINPNSTDKEYLYEEYNSHKILNKISNLAEYKINAESSKTHYTHVYKVSDGAYKGKQIGAWLHIMEMAGHRSLVQWLMENYSINVMAISDSVFANRIRKDNVMFTVDSSRKTEFFCPVDYIWTEEDNIMNILSKMNVYICKYQQVVVHRLNLPITNITAYNNSIANDTKVSNVDKIVYDIRPSKIKVHPPMHTTWKEISETFTIPSGYNGLNGAEDIINSKSITYKILI